MVGWGLRNLVDLDAGLVEVARVLKPGAHLVVLEVATPAREPMRGLYLFYFERVVPRVGRFISRHRTAYNWLPESTRVFPPPTELARRMSAAGFEGVGYRTFLPGVTALHVGTRAG
jgi:demethylmenaquinone methyltransferase/2-methoxy-6-polyprenyl-1,4-benzoquinol methylase